MKDLFDLVERKTRFMVEELNFTELAEKALIAKHLSRKKELTEKEKNFLEDLERIELTDEQRQAVKEEIEKLHEKWKVEAPVVNPKKRGMFQGWTLEDLRKERKRLLKKEKRTPEESTRLREINFAIRAKTGWGKVK